MTVLQGVKITDCVTWMVVFQTGRDLADMDVDGQDGQDE